MNADQINALLEEALEPLWTFPPDKAWAAGWSHLTTKEDEIDVTLECFFFRPEGLSWTGELNICGSIGGEFDSCPETKSAIATIIELAKERIDPTGLPDLTGSEIHLGVDFAYIHNRPPY